MDNSMSYFMPEWKLHERLTKMEKMEFKVQLQRCQEQKLDEFEKEYTAFTLGSICIFSLVFCISIDQ